MGIGVMDFVHGFIRYLAENVDVDVVGRLSEDYDGDAPIISVVHVGGTISDYVNVERPRLRIRVYDDGNAAASAQCWAIVRLLRRTQSVRIEDDDSSYCIHTVTFSGSPNELFDPVIEWPYSELFVNVYMTCTTTTPTQ